MADLKIGRMVIGSVQTNCYFVYREGGKEVLVFDPADRGDHIYETLQKQGFCVKGILLTHAHFDHIWGCNRLKELRACSLPADHLQSGQRHVEEPHIHQYAVVGEPHHFGGQPADLRLPVCSVSRHLLLCPPSVSRHLLLLRPPPAKRRPILCPPS